MNSIWGQVLLPAMAMVLGTGVGGFLIYAVRRFHSLFDELSEIKHEVKPNGGTSIKDTVNRIDTRLQLVSQRLDDHLASAGEGKGKRRWL